MMMMWKAVVGLVFGLLRCKKDNKVVCVLSICLDVLLSGACSSIICKSMHKAYNNNRHVIIIFIATISSLSPVLPIEHFAMSRQEKCVCVLLHSWRTGM